MEGAKMHRLIHSARPNGQEVNESTVFEDEIRGMINKPIARIVSFKMRMIAVIIAKMSRYCFRSLRIRSIL